MFTKTKNTIQKDIEGIIADKAFVTHRCTYSGTPSSYWLPNKVAGECNVRAIHLNWALHLHLCEWCRLWCPASLPFQTSDVIFGNKAAANRWIFTEMKISVEQHYGNSTVLPLKISSIGFLPILILTLNV